jgi:hypothetical protein
LFNVLWPTLLFFSRARGHTIYSVCAMF